MTISTIRPNADGAGVANFLKVGSASTKVAGLADNLSATGIKKDGSLTGIQKCSFTYPDTVSVSATQRVRQVRMRMKATSPSATSKLDGQLGIFLSGVTSYTTPLSIRGNFSSETEFVSPWFQVAPDGQNWNQARLNAIRTQFTEYREDTFQTTITEVYVDIDVANQPTVNIISPTGTSTTTSSPSIEWSFTDTDGDQQSYYQFKIFTPAQYGLAGFDPTYNDPIYDSGEIASSELTAGLNELLQNGTYRIYLRAGKLIAGNIMYSAWDYETFTLNVSAPTVPTLTATVNSNLNYVSLTAVGASITSLGLEYQYFHIMRSDDGTQTWVDVRNATDKQPDGSYAVSVIDYEAPRGIEVAYRVHAVGVAGENYKTSLWSSDVLVTVTNDKQWWFKAVSESDLNMGNVRVTNGTKESIAESVSVFRPLGRNTPIVVGGYVYGKDGSYSIITTTDAEFDLLELLLRYQGKTLVQDPYGAQKYIRIISRSWTAGGTEGRRMRQVDVDYVEIEAY